MARPRSDIQPRIVKAARARFLADGVDGASLREIARDAETNIGMIVYYFPNKDDLFMAVVEEIYEIIVSDLERILRAPGPATDRFRLAFVRLGNASDLEFDILRLILREALVSSKRSRRVLGRFMTGHIPLILETLKQGVRDREFDGAIPLPLLLVMVFGIGALPQVIQRAFRSLPLLSSLPGPEPLAKLSAAMLTRALGPRKPTRKA